MQIKNLTISYNPYNMNEWATLDDFEIGDNSDHNSGLLSFMKTANNNGEKTIYTLPYKEMAYIVLSEMMNGNVNYIGKIMKMCTKE